MMINDVINDFKRYLTLAHENLPFEFTGFKSGFGNLDVALEGGFDRSKLYMIKGRTGSGKTDLAVNLLFGMSGLGYQTAMVTIKNDHEKIAQKMIANVSGVPFKLVRSGIVNDEEIGRIDHAADKISKSSIDIIDEYDDLDKVIKELINVKNKYGLDVIIVDDIELFKYRRSDAELDIKLSALKSIAKQLDIAVIVVERIPEDVSFVNEVTIDIRTRGYAKNNLDYDTVVDNVMYISNEVCNSPVVRISYASELYVFNDDIHSPVMVRMVYMPEFARFDI